MSSIGTGYDLSPTTYSPDGRLYQIEYAGKAVSNSGTVIGIACSDGVVLGVEKLIEYKMLEPESNRRIFNIDYHVGMAVCGWKPDCRQLVNKARSEANQFRSFYGSNIPGNLLTDQLSSHVHLYTLYSGLRPFGASVLIASYDHNKPELFMIDPSGTSWGYHACAIGKGKQVAKTELEKLDVEKMTCVEAAKEIARILHLVHDKAKDKDMMVELSWIGKDSPKHSMLPREFYDQVVGPLDKIETDDEDVQE